MIKLLTESYSPRVGPFYYIDGVVFEDSDDLRDATLVSTGFSDSNNSHYDYWKFSQSIYPEFRSLDYDYYPRGRVVYNNTTDTYYLYTDKCLLDNNITSDIISKFNLPKSKVIISTDDHYQCHQCNKSYVKITENRS